MTEQTAEPGTPQAHIESRRARIFEQLPESADRMPRGEESLPPEQVEHLLRDAQELYWNELAWEELTDEEAVSGGHLTELVFPGFLALIEGLLLDSAPRGATIPPRAHPEVVEEILRFLAEQYAETTAELEQGADSEKLVWARAMTAHLIDLVLYRLYKIAPAEWEALETGD